jgi:fibronectin type 3 domain-containing protein
MRAVTIIGCRVFVLLLLLVVPLGGRAAVIETFTFSGYASTELRAEVHEEPNFSGFPFFDLSFVVINNTNFTLACQAVIGARLPSFNVSGSSQIRPRSSGTVAQGRFNYTDLHGSPSNVNSISCSRVDSNTSSGGGSGAPVTENPVDIIGCPCSYFVDPDSTINSELSYFLYGSPDSVSLWASETPYAGGQFSGHEIVSGGIGGFDLFTQKVTRISALYAPPPYGTYYLSLLALENGQIVDYATFPTPQTFGVSATDGASANDPGGVNPAQPTGLTVSFAGTTSLRIRWADNSDNEDGFLVFQGTASGTDFTQIASVGSNAGSVDVTGLSPSSTYTFVVIAYNQVGYSAYSNVATGSTSALPVISIPDAPSDLQINSLVTTSVRLAWVDNSSDEDGFRIYRSTSASSGFVELATLARNATSYFATGLTPSTRYYFKVVAYNSAGSSAFSNTAIVDTLDDPAPAIVSAAPSGLQASTSTSTTVELGWVDNSSNEDGFRIYRSNSASSGFVELAAVGPGVTSYLASGLVPSTTYYFRVVAYNSAGDSMFSNTATINTLGDASVCGTHNAGSSRECAVPVELGRAVSGFLASSPTANYYAFTLESRSRVDISVYDMDTTKPMRLFDSASNSRGSHNFITFNDSGFQRDLDAGEYYLIIFHGGLNENAGSGYTAYNGAYTLRVDAEPIGGGGGGGGAIGVWALLLLVSGLVFRGRRTWLVCPSRQRLIASPARTPPDRVEVDQAPTRSGRRRCAST